jgi:hypothetical protein
MARIANIELALWYLSLALQTTVVFCLLARRLVSLYPGLFAYLVVNILQSGLLIVVYGRWGFEDFRTEQLAWISQIPVLVMRAWAIADICRLLLARYRGIWGLAWRLLLIVAAGLIFFSIFSAGRKWDHAVLDASASLELTTVVFLITLFLFARHYGIIASPAIRALALGFLIYSSFTVLNHRILERLSKPYVAEWQLLGTLPFLASLGMWLWAVRQPATQTSDRVALLTRDVYYALTPEINLRLRLLNERLDRLWNPKGDRP